jgi:hypothetical protein
MRSEGYRDLVKCSVEIELSSGKMLLGVVEKPRAKSFADFMNGAGAFLEVHLYDSSVVQVSKASILVCRQRTEPRADSLNSAMNGADVANPLVILGIKAAESRDQVRRAYLSRMRLYHSDRYGGIELPPEVLDHLENMAKRINVAYRDALAMCEAGANGAGANGQNRHN